MAILFYFLGVRLLGRGGGGWTKTVGARFSFWVQDLIILFFLGASFCFFFTLAYMAISKELPVPAISLVP